MFLVRLLQHFLHSGLFPQVQFVSDYNSIPMQFVAGNLHTHFLQSCMQSTLLLDASNCQRQTKRLRLDKELCASCACARSGVIAKLEVFTAQRSGTRYNICTQNFRFVLTQTLLASLTLFCTQWEEDASTCIEFALISSPNTSI